MDRFVAFGSDYACWLLGFSQSSVLRVSLCYSTEGNRYATGMAFWFVAAILIGAVFVAQRRASTTF